MKKLLAVDDSRTVRKMAKQMIGSLGLEVLEAEDGQKALELVRSEPDVDVVLLDWNMPVMDGLTFLKTIREEPLPNQPVVVMCTTENEMTRIMEALQAGANEYIMKPFTEDIVRDKLEETGVL